MKIKYIIVLIICCFFLSGCALNPYHNQKFGCEAIDSWFSYTKNNLGETRMKLENIKEIISRECKYLEDDSKTYIFKCSITYQPIGETIIPLSKDKIINVYVAFTPKINSTYTYKVYNSSSKEGIWKLDENLNYKERR